MWSQDNKIVNVIFTFKYLISVSGSIPGPILFGKLIDITCDLWQDHCGEQGSCFSYNNKQMSHNMLALVLSGKFLSSIFFLLALVLYKVPKHELEDEMSCSSNKVTDSDKEDSPPPPTPLTLDFSTSGTLKSNQSVHTALTMISADSTPTTPASPNGHSHPQNWSHL